MISIGELIDRSVEHYKKHFRDLISISSWFLVTSVAGIIGLLIAPPDNSTATPALATVIVLLSICGYIISIVVTNWIPINLAYAIDDQNKKGRVDGQTIIARVKERFWKFLLFNIVFGLLAALIALAIAGVVMSMAFGVFVGSKILTIGGFIGIFVVGILALGLIIRLQMIYFISMFDFLYKKTGIKESILAADKLIRGKFWAIFARNFVTELIYGFFSTVLAGALIGGLFLIGVVFSESDFAARVLSSLSLIAGQLIAALYLPMSLITRSYLYDDLKRN